MNKLNKFLDKLTAMGIGGNIILITTAEISFLSYIIFNYFLVDINILNLRAIEINQIISLVVVVSLISSFNAFMFKKISFYLLKKMLQKEMNGVDNEDK